MLNDIDIRELHVNGFILKRSFFSKDEINALSKACLQFGGVDIIVHSAGLAISKPIEETTLADWDLLQNVLVKGQFLLAQSFATIFRKQKLGGNIVNIASKNGLVAGPNNLEYLNSGYFLGSGLPLGSGVEHPQVTHINHQPLNKLCPHC